MSVIPKAPFATTDTEASVTPFELTAPTRVATRNCITAIHQIGVAPRGGSCVWVIKEDAPCFPTERTYLINLQK